MQTVVPELWVNQVSNYVSVPRTQIFGADERDLAWKIYKSK